MRVQVWFKVLFYGLAFEPTGPFVHMVFQIAYAVRSFAVLLLMACVSFGVAMMVLSSYVPAALQHNQFVNDFGLSLLTMWRGVLGQFYIDWALGSAWQQLSIIFFSVFMFIVQIILLNMLIALMRDIYQRVRPQRAVGLRAGSCARTCAHLMLSRGVCVEGAAFSARHLWLQGLWQCSAAAFDCTPALRELLHTAAAWRVGYMAGCSAPGLAPRRGLPRGSG